MGPAPEAGEKRISMLVRFLSGPKVNQTQHVPRDASSQLLLDAGLIEEVRNAGPSADITGVPLHGSQHVIPPMTQTIEWGRAVVSRSTEPRCPSRVRRL